jgi:acetyl esterase/lipase
MNLKCIDAIMYIKLKVYQFASVVFAFHPKSLVLLYSQINQNRMKNYLRYIHSASLVIMCLLSFNIFALAQADKTAKVPEYETIRNIFYYGPDTAADAYMKERCKLDICYPTTEKNFATVIWFHGGGLEAGEKYFPAELMEKKIAVITVSYRLSPRALCPSYIEDAAAAVAWAFKNIAKYGGDTTKLFVAGHSAGGYLTLMVGLDKHWLGVYGIDANRIAGLIPFSGQTMTHYTIRKERKLPQERPVIDEFAPVYHVRADAPPMLLITGGREIEQLGRYEENAYLARLMKLSGHKKTNLIELNGFDHSGMERPGLLLLLKFIHAPE